MKKMLIIASGLIPLAFIFYPVFFVSTASCVPPESHYAPIPEYSNLYSFPKFNIPEAKSAGSVNLTTVIIVPEYKDTYTQEYAGGARVAAGGPITTGMLKVFKSFAGSLGEDVQAQLVAKGMTTKGPYAMSEVTYPDKKGADLTVSTNIIFDINYSSTAKYIGERSFTGGVYGKMYSYVMTVGMKVYYQMLEPLSEEKMWIKKLDLGVQEFPFTYAMQQERYVTGSDGCGGYYYGWRDTNTYIYDERVKIFSDVLKSSYPQIMKTAWNYLDMDEMLNLKQKSQEIRERKRY